VSHALKTLKEKFYAGRLSEVRKKDPEVSEAALFVEGLFGRPLRNDPEVLNININPFTSHSGKHVNLPKKFKPKYLFVFPFPAGPLWTRTSSSIHELVHSEDIGPPKSTSALGFILQNTKGAFDIVRRCILEGRAVFAQQIHNGKIERFNSHFKHLIVGASLMAVSVATDIQLLVIPAAFSLTLGILYWPFHNALCSLSKKVGDPVKAFKMTTDKPPSFAAILFPARYYKKEIEAIKGQNSACSEGTA